MKLSDALANLQEARDTHLKLVVHAEAMIAGSPLIDEMIPVKSTDCDFGKWYFSIGQYLGVFSSFAALERPHDTLHGYYQEIFDLFDADDDRSTITKLFESDQSRREKIVKEAKVLISRINMESKVFFRAVEILERELSLYTKKGVIDPSVHKGA